MVRKKAVRQTGTPEQVPKQDQETVICWYKGAKLVDVHSTSYTEICLLKRRGWHPLEGKDGSAAAPYLVFRLPRKAITIRSKRSLK